MLNCEQFEELLPEVVDGGAWSADQKTHTQGCAKCSSLVEDLRRIEQEAPELAEMHEPSREYGRTSQVPAGRGHHSPAGKARPPHGFLLQPALASSAGAAGAMAALVIIFVAYKSDSRPPNTAQNTAVHRRHEGCRTG